MTSPAFVIVPFERTQLLHETGELSRCAIVRRPTRSELLQFYELGQQQTATASSAARRTALMLHILHLPAAAQANVYEI